MNEQSEYKIQQQIVMYYRNNFCLNHHSPQHVIFSVPNESKSKKETIQKIAIGMLSGVSDLIILRAGETIFVEVKTATGQQSQKQKEFQSIVEKLGYRYLLVRSLNDFKEKINS